MDFLRYFFVLFLLLPSAAMAIGFTGTDLQGRACVGQQQGYGPYDYTNAEHFKKKLPIVESYHFTPEVERLIKGKSASVFGDLDYTVRAFPNHHRALYSMIRYATEKGGRMERKPPIPPECYLQRAIRFQPRDGVVYMLFGLYLHKLKHLQDAESYYKQAIALIPESPEANYNYGLLLTDLERYEEAKPYALKAYGLGYPLQGLRRRLASAGVALNP